MAAIDYFSEFTVNELRTHLKQLQKGLLNPARSILFKDQQLQFSNTQEIKDRIEMVVDSINIKTGKKTGKKKRVQLTTRNRGFE